jgi:transcription termination factor Rho
VSVLQRQELEQSPLADLHAIASELGIEGYRSLRRDDLVVAIIKAQGGDPAAEEAPEPSDPSADADPEADAGDDDGEPEPEPEAEPDEPEPAAEPVSGVLDILNNGSGFLRVGGRDADDVYVSPAQIRRCELRAGDQVEGPLRPPRRSERHPSLVRIEKVNGHDAEPPEQRRAFDELTPVHPTERLPAPDTLDPVPFGKGSRVAIAGGPGAGATRLLREVVWALADAGGLQVAVVLVGARPEEVTDWKREGRVDVTGGSFDRSPETQAQAADLAIERGKRAVERGDDAVVVIDSLESLSAGAARRLFGAARNAEEGGSLTVIAATGMAWEPQRQASTRISLDAPGEDGRPQLSASRSGTHRADALA